MTFFMYLDRNQTKYLSTSAKQLSKAINLSEGHIRRVLKDNEVYRKKDYILLKFNESDVLRQKPRNPQGYNGKSVVNYV